MSRRAEGLTLLAGCLLLVVLLAGMAAQELDRHGAVVALNLSSDGRYALSSHGDGRLVLWNLEDRTAETLSTSANIYSAYIPQESDLLLWQEHDNQVIVRSIDGAAVRRFESFPSYGHLITPDTTTYIASDERWRLYRVNEDESVDPIKTDGDSPSFIGTGKLLNLDLHVEKGLLLSVGRGLRGRDERLMTDPLTKQSPAGFSYYAGVVIWDQHTGEPLHKLPGNSNKTHAVLSPDGEHVVGVDENGLSHIWRTDTGAIAYTKQHNFHFGVYVGGHDLGSEENWTDEGAHLTYPDDFPEGFSGGAMVAVQFISETEYLTFYTYKHYAVLYEVGDPFARAVFDLGDDPFPSVSSYARNASIATAPEANLLVTGQRDGGGINVYRYDPDTRTLEREWAWEKPSRWWRP